jgi:anti-sigma factor RsiW
MTTHLTEGQLRAALDGELDPSALRHLESCAACRERQHLIQLHAAEVAQHLAFLSAPAPLAERSVQASLQRFRNRTLSQKETSMLKQLFRSTAIRVLVVLALLITVVVSVPPFRAFADEILNLFRVQQVTVVPIDTSGLQQLAGDEALGKQISQLVSSSATVTEKPGDPQSATDAADASQKAGFSVRLPQNEAASRLTVEGKGAFTFRIDRTKAQALMDEAGRSDLVLPDSIDGAVISVTVPASVRADYGTCPDPSQSENAIGGGSPGRRYPDCVIFAQLPSPTVEAPAGVDVSQLAQIALQFTGMSSEQARDFAQSVNWTSTLVIPVPKNASTYEQVSVDGVTGTLIQRPADDAPQYLLIWVKDGIVYSIAGLGTNSQQALDMANSLP